MKRKELMESLASSYPTLKFEEGISQLLIYPQYYDYSPSRSVVIPRVANFSEEEVAKILSDIEPIAQQLMSADQATEELVKREIAEQRALAAALVEKYQSRFPYPLVIAAYRSWYEIWLEIRPGENQRTVGRSPVWIPYVGLAHGGEYTNPKANPMATNEEELIQLLKPIR
jgi:hypothetical protein